MFVKTHLLQKEKCGGVMVRDFGPQNGGLMGLSPFTSILYAS
jgi:hypothetical protein